MWYGGALFCAGEQERRTRSHGPSRCVSGRLWFWWGQAYLQQNSAVQSHYFVFVVYQAQLNCATSSYGYQSQQVLYRPADKRLLRALCDGTLTHSLQTTSKAPYLSL